MGKTCPCRNHQNICTLNSGVEEEDTELPKVKAELLASRMKQWKYLDEGLKITLYRYRQKNLEEFLTLEGTLVTCKNVDGLFKALHMNHCSD